MKHACPAAGCHRAVPPRVTLCRRCWARVPAHLRAAVIRLAPAAGREPSSAFSEAVQAAVAAAGRHAEK